MKCQRVRHRFQKYVSGDLPENLHSSITDHVNSCPECMQELRGWQKVFAILETPKALAPSDAFTHQVMHRIDKANQRQGQSSLLRIWTYICTQPLQASIGVTLVFAIFVMPLISQYFTEIDITLDTHRVSNLLSPVTWAAQIDYYANTLYARFIQAWVTSSNTLLENLRQLMLWRL